MARATYEDVLKRTAGNYPGSWDQSAVTDLCTRADRIIDSYTSPQTISETSDEAVEIAVDVVMRLMAQGEMFLQSSGTTGAGGRAYPLNMEILTPEIKIRIKNLLRDDEPAKTIDMV